MSDRNVDYSGDRRIVNAFTLSRLSAVLFAVSGVSLTAGVDWRLCLTGIAIAVLIPFTYSTRQS